MKSEIENKVLPEHFVAIKAAIEAGSEIMRIYEGGNFQIESKEDNSPITLADKSANTIINEFLKPTGIPIISEENAETEFSERKLWDSCWIVDPLDGTKEFINKNGEFTVNIALVKNNKPVFGVIYIPVSKELYFGNVVEGSSFKMIIDNKTLEEDLLKYAEEIFPVSAQRTIRIAGSRSHINEETLEFIEGIRKKYSQEVKVIPKGSSLKFCLIADGTLNIYPRIGTTMEWDTAAGHAICKAVGIRVFDMKTNRELVYNKQNLKNNSFVVSNLLDVS
ncbi:3'(2'),5'-bisphosphate nucleotidase CysQ [Salegentibacter mishustinae]|uniref:3'(2'),5'-bisphosphate nucleotidase CysQ n=1 Tax=Salegentibacter mishustinae TaxID=270918 RepID=UPI001CE181FE|nr:3'(2'),5'-bisphosphate nucleotidase CysQ [Salegentibacter mishustinae]UBZ06873.1 3'(2'),5'-bisphosphate nucleotidase CysQ [Salegentibacter mishustinae]